MYRFQKSIKCISFLKCVYVLNYFLQTKLTRIKDKISAELRKINALHADWTNRLISQQKATREMQETLDDLRNTKLGV